MSESLPIAPDATRELARFASSLKFEDIPTDLIEHVKLLVLDGIGCCIQGATLPWTRMVARMALAEGARPVATIVGSGKQTSIALAVLVNSTAGHAFELDDIHTESVLHPNSITVPIAVAFAQANGDIDGRMALAAIVAGYEVGTRIGTAATTALFLRGFHPQGTTGTFVAAATAGKLLGLNSEQMQHALGVAGSQAAGLMAAQEGAMVKRLHSGRAAQSGVYAAQLAADGFTGILDIVEVPYGGFISSFSGSPAPERLLEGLGSRWETGSVGFKPYASVTSIHTSLDGLRSILAANQLSADDVASVHVRVGTMTHVHCAWPYRPAGVTAAQMNLFFGLALIAIDGAAFVEQYNETRLKDPRIVQFMEKITCDIDPEIDAMGPKFRHAARIEVVARDGGKFRSDILKRRGSPENPLTAEEVIEKFRAVAGPHLSAERSDRLIELALKVERPGAMQSLVAELTVE